MHHKQGIFDVFNLYFSDCYWGWWSFFVFNGPLRFPLFCIAYLSSWIVLFVSLGIFWIQGLFTFCFLIFLLYRPDFVFLPLDCLFVKHVLLLPYFCWFYSWQELSVWEYIFYATNLIKKSKERAHWLLYYKETFILKAWAMQNKINFQSKQ